MSRFILDADVVSAMRRPRRNPEVAEWFRLNQHGQFFLSVLTLAELQQGIELARDPGARVTLQRWFLRVRALYEGRIIPFAIDEALAWGTLYAPLRIAGRPPAVIDSMIGATAMVHGLAVVTGNDSDFEPLGVEVVNPWAS